MFIGYWRDAEATAEKFVGDRMLTGDLAVTDEEGYVRFVGRNDDVITSSGYRIGPAEIEDCLASHPAVALAAAVGKPDRVRTEIVKAFVVLRPGHAPGDAMAAALQEHVKQAIAPYKYPRAIEFRDALPRTETGKLQRFKLRKP
jgi:acetyl-CoA synthetase